MKEVRWGILGCGKIAGKFASDLGLIPEAVRYAAASRDAVKAEGFARQWGFAKAYGSYEAMLADPEVDAVYVATPHSHHHEHALLAIRHGKPVLVEKAFALNLAQAQEMVDEARKHRVFLMEAFWTRLQPSFGYAMETLKSGILGPARLMRSEFCFYSPYKPESRLFNLDLGGGALLDIGIYPVFWALELMGEPDEIDVTADLAPTGADQSIAMTFGYDGGKIAQLASSFTVCSDTQTEIWCEKGFIRIRRVDPHTVTVTVNRKDQSETTETFSHGNGFGLYVEARHMMECLDAGLIESPILSHSFTLRLMNTLDRIRAAAGILYPADQTQNRKS